MKLSLKGFTRVLLEIVSNALTLGVPQDLWSYERE